MKNETAQSDESDYMRFRGKCRELSEAAVAADPTLRLERGYYVCPFWGKQAHWWTVRADGSVYDPSKAQFPSNGLGDYDPFDGTMQCEECGKAITEDEAIECGNYAVCSTECACRLVGVA